MFTAKMYKRLKNLYSKIHSINGYMNTCEIIVPTELGARKVFMECNSDCYVLSYKKLSKERIFCLRCYKNYLILSPRPIDLTVEQINLALVEVEQYVGKICQARREMEIDHFEKECLLIKKGE